MQAAAARAAIVLAFFCMVGVFLPAGRLDLGGKYAAGHTSRSFFQIGKSTGAVRTFVARYQASTAKRIGAKALDKVAPHLPGRLRGDAGDVQDAMTTLDDLRDEDVKLVGRIVATTMWSLLALNLLVIALLYGTTEHTRRLRVAAALAVSLVTALVAVAVCLVLRTVVAEANAEIEAPLFALRGGAYIMPATAVASFLATIAWFVFYLRARARTRAFLRGAPLTPPPKQPAPIG